MCPYLISSQFIHAGFRSCCRLEGVRLLCEGVLCSPGLRLSLGLASLGLDQAVEVDEVAVLAQEALHRTLSILVNGSLALKVRILFEGLTD